MRGLERTGGWIIMEASPHCSEGNHGAASSRIPRRRKGFSERVGCAQILSERVGCKDLGVVTLYGLSRLYVYVQEHTHVTLIKEKRP